MLTEVMWSAFGWDGEMCSLVSQSFASRVLCAKMVGVTFSEGFSSCVCVMLYLCLTDCVAGDVKGIGLKIWGN